MIVGVRCLVVLRVAYRVSRVVQLPTVPFVVAVGCAVVGNNGSVGCGERSAIGTGGKAIVCGGGQLSNVHTAN